MTLDPTTFLTILAMALVTYLTRIGGLWLMSRVPISGRVEAGLQQVPGAVLLAIVVPGLVRGGPVEWLAALLTVAVAIRTGQLLPSMGAGLALVILARLIGF